MRAVLYTKTCTKMSLASHPALAATPRGVAAWRERLTLGEDPLPWLAQCRNAAQASQGQGIWIHLPDEVQWQQQLTLLAKRLAERPTAKAPRSELLQRYPLLGMPFAVKDNIHIAGAPTTAACPAFAHVPNTPPQWCNGCSMLGRCGWARPISTSSPPVWSARARPTAGPTSAYDAQRISGGSSSGSAVARGAAAWWPSRWAPTRRARAACPPASTTSSG